MVCTEEYKTGIDYRIVGLILGPLLAIAILLGPNIGAEFAPKDYPYAPKLALAMLVWTFVWWVASPLPLGVTALLPAVFSSVVAGFAPQAIGYTSTSAAVSDIWKTYMSTTIVLFLGGFMIAGALAEVGMDKRIAYALAASRFGRRNLHTLALALWTSCWFVSMWISNTAAAAIMYPIALGVITAVPRLSTKYQEFLMLGLGYAATMGGLATIIGTPPNLIAVQQAAQAGVQIPFFSFMILGVPTAIIGLLVCFFVMLLYFRPEKEMAPEAIKVVEEEKAKLGKMTREQWIVTIGFILAVFMWIARGFPAIFESMGLTDLAKSTEIITKILPDDCVPPIIIAIALFAFPKFFTKKPLKTILTWEGVNRYISWDILLIFGGGLVIGNALLKTGLGKWLAVSTGALFGGLSPFIIFLVAALTAYIITQFTSNTSTAAMICPIVIALAIEGGFGKITAAQASIIAGIMASIAITLPISTPPNAIVFGSGKIQLKNMIANGLIIGLILLVVYSAIWIYGLPHIPVVVK